MSTYTQDITHLIGKINTNLPDNDTQAITAARIRDAMGAVAYNYDLYVLKTDLDTAGYVTASQLEGLATEQELQEGMQTVHDDAYAYVVEKINEIPGVDLSAYVTKTELSEMGYITENDLPDMSTYATKAYVADYVAEHAPMPDLSAYVTKTELSQASYVTQNELSNMGYITTIPAEYVTDTELSNMGYVTQSQLSANSYATTSQLSAKQDTLVSGTNIKTINNESLLGSGNINIQGGGSSIAAVTQAEYDAMEQAGTLDPDTLYVISDAQSADLDDYVTKTELSAAGYLTAVPSEYITETELSGMGYITSSALGDYVTQTELSSAGYLTSIPAEYVTQSQLSANSYVTQSQLSANSYVTQSQLSANSYVTATELSNVLSTASYVTQNELSQMGYITNSDLSQASYVTQQALSGMGYLTAVPSEYVTETELSAAGYITSSYAETYYVDYASFGDYTSDMQSTLVDANILITDPETGDWTTQAMASETYVAEYVASYAPTPDLSAYVTKTELSAAGYLTAVPSEYVTESEIASMGYITETELSGMSYATTSYVADYVASYAPTPDLSAYVSKTELSAMSYATTTQVNAKQDTLVSGTNIKTINNESLLGSGDITIQAGGGSPDYSHVLKFTAEQATSSVTLNRVGSDTSLANAVLKYSTDNGASWTDYTLGTSIALAAIGDSVMFKGTNAKLGISGSNYHQFVMTGKISASGDVTSLLNEFGGNIQITAYGCYGLFSGCASLTEAPTLPTKSLSQYCYSMMFYACTSLTDAPELPATTLANYCYYRMFEGCTSLTKAPELPATTCAERCYQNMFYNCRALTKAPELPATTLKTYCYGSMFYGCTSLTKAPDLPATTLAARCYENMFNGCINLKYVKAMFTTTPSNTYTQNWLYNVSSTGTFVKSSSASWGVIGTNGVPSGWTIYKTVAIDTDDFPESYVEDNGKGLQVVNGAWQKVSGLLTSANLIYDSTTNTLTINV